MRKVIYLKLVRWSILCSVICVFANGAIFAKPKQETQEEETKPVVASPINWQEIKSKARKELNEKREKVRWISYLLRWNRKARAPLFAPYRATVSGRAAAYSEEYNKLSKEEQKIKKDLKQALQEWREAREIYRLVIKMEKLINGKTEKTQNASPSALSQAMQFSK